MWVLNLEASTIRRKLTSATPEWSRKIEAFRQSLNLTQLELGKKVGASSMAISRWERGESEPPSNTYILLGRLAGDPLCWFFWGRAGLSTADIMRVLPSANTRLVDARIANVKVVQAVSPSAISLPRRSLISPIAFSRIGHQNRLDSKGWRTCGLCEPSTNQLAADQRSRCHLSRVRKSLISSRRFIDRPTANRKPSILSPQLASPRENSRRGRYRCGLLRCVSFSARFRESGSRNILWIVGSFWRISVSSRAIADSSV